MEKLDKANISDVILESAISTIVDNEDSVAALIHGQIKCYKNWLGLMKGDLEIECQNGKKFIRKLNKDRNYISPREKISNCTVELYF